MSKPKYKIRPGQVYNLLTIIQSAGKNKFGKSLWLCQCKCGNQTTAVSTELGSGHKKSCGCLAAIFQPKALEIPGFKRCTICHILKPFEEYCKHNKGKEGLHSWCNTCRHTKDRQYQLDDPNRECIQKMLDAARKRAKDEGLPFNIKKEDIIIPNLCPLLAIPLMRGKVRHTTNSPTLDRILPNLGYVRGNVWVISHRANIIKQDAYIDELELLTKNFRAKLTDLGALIR